MMPDDLSLQPTIRILPPDEARKIAAGEVIERPASLVREFIDNAIDAQSPLIEVVLDGGGVKKTEVRDFGSGMGRDNLELACLPHATSKIRSIDDLNRVKSLGFRGEALAAACAVSALEIITSTDGREAWRLEMGPAAPANMAEGAASSDFLGAPRIESARRVRGTTVRAKFLFDTIPARKRFLKRDSSEVNLCRNIFIDKALAFPNIAFRFIVDGKLKLFFPVDASRRDRFAAALLNSGESGFLHEIEALGEGFSAGIVLGGPELYRQDRRFQYIFANGRRITDYPLMQAIEYGVQGWFPNGTHPVGAVYIEIDPALADFNIHPAKREARFSDGGAIHHAVSAGLRDFCRRRGIAVENRPAGDGREGSPDENAASPHGESFLFDRAFAGRAEKAAERRAWTQTESGGALAMEALLEQRPNFAPLPGHASGINAVAEESPLYGEPHYAGRAFGLDCWVVPLFKKWWNGTRFARKRYWYLDGPSK